MHRCKRKGKVPLHTLTYPTDLHVRAHRQAPSLLECRALSLFLRGSPAVCMGICPMMGAVSGDSGRQTHPYTSAQPLVAVRFAVAVLVKSRVAAHVRCPLLVKWQWSNGCIYVSSASQISHSLRQGLRSD